MKDDTKKVAIGAVIAGLAGFALGILTAPKSGKETRKDIQNAAIKAKTEAEKHLKQLHSELNNLMQQAKATGGKLTRTASAELTKALQKAQKAQTKARELLSALHDGDATDKDLKKAMDDVDSAIKQLKAFMAKNGSTQKAK